MARGMFVGVDDTDSPAGGCTTHFGLLAAAAFRREHGLVLRSRARLVRLNPNIPWKTRGNAAVALELGKPSGGGAELVGVAPDGTEVLLDRGAREAAPAPAHAATLDALIGELCDLDAPGTDPAYVLCARPPPRALYEGAVCGVVDPGEVRRALEAEQPRPIWKALGDGRGIVGAAAAAAFPEENTTFEIIVYRSRERWGTKRSLDFDSVERMDRTYRSTYNNLDRANGHVAIAPATPCPLLFGIRAFSPGELRDAAASVTTGEAWAGWLLFETNQGTDAHVVLRGMGAVEPRLTVSVEGKVVRGPRRLKGGHVVMAIADESSQPLECAAYEPTKEFRKVVGALEVGDRVRAVGAIREDRRTLNLEKLQVVSTVPRRPSAVNPVCPDCGRRMKSAGKSAPFRCRPCGRKVAKEATALGPPAAGPAAGWYEVPVCARRHLARPLDAHDG